MYFLKQALILCVQPEEMGNILLILEHKPLLNVIGLLCNEASATITNRVVKHVVYFKTC